MENNPNQNYANILFKQIKKDIEKEYQRKIETRETSAKNINKVLDKNLTVGEKLADSVARIGGSWKFIIGFALFLILWMIINIFFLVSKAFDPYPFILLNLCLSCLAAIQAPIIMMSQNRQAKKDRLEAEEDFRTNIRSEVQIQAVITKLDLFIDLYLRNLTDSADKQNGMILKDLEEIKALLNRSGEEKGKL
ncbi:MAG TPA: DUF1003 domain-containing protein [Ignavibacteriales bacterium]|nr:DUF1003 domain-containing protein [Ignavibacteriales bacterium]HEX3073152.1 DUF1003 domain-containing protein [Ignavibacteriales bacterium]